MVRELPENIPIYRADKPSNTNRMYACNPPFKLILLPVSNGGSELFLTYLRAQKELGTILPYLNVSAWVLFFLVLDFYNFYF